MFGQIFDFTIVGGLLQYGREQYVNKNTSNRYRDRNRKEKRRKNDINCENSVLITSSTITFGNDCERLINMAYQTGQSSPTMMSSYADISHYLRKQLAKLYPDEYFHIMIGENDRLSFAADDSQYFAEIKHNRNRILIFSS